MKWPGELVEDIARRRAVLYIGAGVSSAAQSSTGARPPGWVEFLERANRRLDRRVPSATVKQMIRDNDLLTACELLKTALDESWPQVLKDEFISPGYQSGLLHRSLHELDLPIVLTPNFDSIYDRFASSETNGATVVKNYWDSDIPLILRRKYRSIIKVHGSIDEPSKMIFSRGDYAQLRVDHRRFFDLMGALFLTHTFLFVGTSLSDPDLRLFLESYHHSHPNSPPHYMTSPSGAISPHADASIRSNMNIKLLRYSPEDSHSELVSCVNDLVARVNIGREEMARTEGW